MTTDSKVMTDAGIMALFDLGFQRFITLSIIKIVYAIGLGLIVLALVVSIIMGFIGGVMSGLLALIVGPIVALLYMVFFRMWLELVVVMFRIGENTSKLADKLAGGSAPAMPTGTGA